MIAREGFTSTLSASEFALLSDLGPEPVAQVLGTSVYQVGWQYLPPEAQWYGDHFSYLETISAAWNQARADALQRMRAEASSVAADAVVGVTLRRGKHDWGRRSVDFVASGTAVRLRVGRVGGFESGPARPEPMLSNLSVQDYWQLVRGGWNPAGLVAATSACFVSQGLARRWRRRLSFLRNQELDEFSDGFSGARRSAVDNLRRQARDLGASGVVGASFEYELERRKMTVRGVGRQPSGFSPETIGAVNVVPPFVPFGATSQRAGLMFTVHVVGTAIRRHAPAEQPRPELRLALGEAR